MKVHLDPYLPCWLDKKVIWPLGYGWMASSVWSPGPNWCPGHLRVLQTNLEMRSLISSRACQTPSQRGRSPVVNRPQGSTVCETSQTATWVWGAIPYLSIGLLPNVPTLEHVMRGLRLSSNGLGSSGRCGVGADFGTSDPQEPQEPVNFSATFC